MQVYSLSRSPLKSGRLEYVSSYDMRPKSSFDRSFCIIDRGDRVLTARTHPHLQQVRFEVIGRLVRIHIPGLEAPLEQYIPVPSPMSEFDVSLWGIRGTGVYFDKSGAIDVKISQYLGVPGCHVVQVIDDKQRLIPEEYVEESGIVERQLGWRDGGQISLVSLGTLYRLQDVIKQSSDLKPITNDHLRMNIVVDSEEEEFYWKRIRIGGFELIAQKPCSRCTMINIDQQTGEMCKGSETYLALFAQNVFQGHVLFAEMNSAFYNQYARGTKASKVYVGMNYMPTLPLEVRRGTADDYSIHLGDTVEVLEYFD